MNMMKYVVAISLMFIVGCIEMNPTIYTTKQYEGHYYSKESIEEAVKAINLQKNESVWILSNTTLKRVLKNNK